MNLNMTGFYCYFAANISLKTPLLAQISLITYMQLGIESSKLDTQITKFNLKFLRNKISNFQY